LEVELQEAHPQGLVRGGSGAHRLQYFRVFVLQGAVEGEVGDFGVLPAAGGLAVPEVLHPEPALQAEHLLLPQAHVLELLVVPLVAGIVFFETHTKLYSQYTILLISKHPQIANLGYCPSLLVSSTALGIILTLSSITLQSSKNQGIFYCFAIIMVFPEQIYISWIVLWMASFFRSSTV